MKQLMVQIRVTLKDPIDLVFSFSFSFSVSVPFFFFFSFWL